MGKYFSSNSDLSKYNITGDNSVDITTAIPSTDNLTKPLSDQVKTQLSRTTKTPNDAKDEDEYISIVRDQTDQTTETIQKFSEEAKLEIKNQFKKFSPLELFEKMNQMLFIISQLSNRVVSLEEKIDTLTASIGTLRGGSVENVPKKIERTTTTIKAPTGIPRGIPNSAQKNDKDTSSQPPSANDVKRQLAEITSGKSTQPLLPTDGYIDNGVKLEEVFPNLDDEAYQAAYRSMSETKPVPMVEDSKPSPGAMRGITGF